MESRQMLSAVTLVSAQAGGSAGAGGNGHSMAAAISSDGRYTLFTSTSTNLVTGQVDTAQAGFGFYTDLFRYDKQTGETILVTRVNGTTTTAANGSDPGFSQARLSAVMSDNGRYIAFSTPATNIIAGQSASTNSINNVFYFDADTDTTTLVTHTSSSTTTTANGSSNIVDITADGRYLVYRSDATNLINGVTDTNSGTDIFWYDTQTDTTKLVSHSAASINAAGNSFSSLFPSPNVGDNDGLNQSGYTQHRYISDDGRYVVFFSIATNLVVGDTNQDTNSNYDVFRWDSQLDNGTNILISRATGFTTKAANASSDASSPQMSSDGRYITFYSHATNLISGVTDANSAADVFQFDADTETMTLISHSLSSNTNTASVGSSGVRYISTSEDGSIVAFSGFYTNIVASQSTTGFAPDLFVWKRATNTNAILTKQAGTTGTSGNHVSETDLAMAVSDDGSAVIFTDKSNNLVASQSSGINKMNVYHYTVASGALQLLSHTTSSAVTGANDESFYPFVSSDGSFIAFVSPATNLVTGHTGTQYDIYLTSPSLPPTTSGLSDLNALEDDTTIQVDLWAAFADLSDTDSQLTYSVTGNTNSALVSTSIQNSGHGQYLLLTLASNQNGSSNLTVRATNTGGFSITAGFTINVTAVNDAPSFSASNPPSVLIDAGLVTVANWATVLSKGATDESAQTLTFLVSNVSNAGLFAVQPSVGSDGTLTYTLADGVSGTSTFSVALQDDGGTANGGSDTSGTQNFTITVNDPANNIAPVITGLTLSHNYILPGDPLTLNVANLSDADDGVAEIRFYRDADGNGALDTNVDTFLDDIGSPGATAALSLDAEQTDLALGTYTLFAVALDHADALSNVLKTTVDICRVVDVTSRVIYVDSQGKSILASLTGPTKPFKIFYTTNAVQADPAAIEIPNATLASSFSLTAAKNVKTLVKRIIVGNPLDPANPVDMGTIKAPAMTLGSEVTVTGGMKSLTLGDSLADVAHTITLGSSNAKPTQAVTMVFGSQSDTSIDSDQVITALTAREFVTGNLTSRITAKQINKIKTTGVRGLITGDFSSNILIDTDPGVKKLAIGPVTIAGQLSGTWTINGSAGAIKAKAIQVWDAGFAGDVTSITTSAGNFAGGFSARSVGTVTVKGNFQSDFTLTQTLDPKKQALKSLTVAGAILGSTLSSSGNLGAITASFIGGDTVISAGITLAGFALPIDITDFSAPTTVLKSLTITGKPTPTNPSFGSAIIAAGVINSVSLKVVDTAAGADDYGFAANTIGSFKRSNAAALSNLTNPLQSVTDGKFILRVV